MCRAQPLRLFSPRSFFRVAGREEVVGSAEKEIGATECPERLLVNVQLRSWGLVRKLLLVAPAEAYFCWVAGFLLALGVHAGAGVGLGRGLGLGLGARRMGLRAGGCGPGAS